MDPISSQPSQDSMLAAGLRRLVQSAVASGNAVLPNSADALLKSIVKAAASIFGAAASSILLVNAAEQVLEFRVNYGSADRDLVGMKIPLNKGIAGYVVMTGQPIAISDVQQDTRFNQDFAKSTGYVPRSILATPLLSGDRVIGVMEVLDKISAPAFGLQDMDLLGLFAQQAAIAIAQSQQVERLNETLVDGLKRLVDGDEAGQFEVLQQALDLAAKGDDVSNDLRALALAFNALSSLGEAERRACLKILAAFTEYSRPKKKFQW
jgi:GAF domain-containing protein